LKEGVFMKVSLYIRGSSSNDLKIQLKALRKFATLHGWKIIGEHIDHSTAADPLKRKSWTELLEQANKRGFNLLLIQNTNRISRNIPFALNALKQLKSRGVNVRSVE